MLYLDTSLLVTAMTPEPATRAVQSWLEAHAANEIAISEWVATEFSAALSVKLRNNKIDTDQVREAMAQFSRMAIDSADVLQITTEHFRLAARFAQISETGIRAGDALHLAIASTAFATLCTRDQRMAQAGTKLGVSTILL